MKKSSWMKLSSDGKKIWDQLTDDDKKVVLDEVIRRNQGQVNLTELSSELGIDEGALTSLLGDDVLTRQGRMPPRMMTIPALTNSSTWLMIRLPRRHPRILATSVV